MRTKAEYDELKRRIGRMTKKELERRLLDAYTELDNIGPEPRDAYQRGWDDAVQHYWMTMARLHDDLHKYYMATSYTMGIATAGFGDTPRTMLKDLSGKIAEAGDRVQNEIETIEQLTGRQIDVLPFVEEADEIKAALHAMYNRQDKTGDGLRAIAARINPFIERNVLIDRPLLTPGRKQSDVIRHVCELAQPLFADGKTTEEVLTTLQDRLADDPSAEDELDYVSGVEATSFNRAYQRHNMKS